MKNDTLLNILFFMAIAVAIAMYFLQGNMIFWGLLPIVPLLYLAITRNWVELGFTRKNLFRSLLVGVFVGLIIGGIRFGVILLATDFFINPNYIQSVNEYYSMICGTGYLTPLLILLFIPINTFQEIFYRSYLQIQFTNRLRSWIKSETVRVVVGIGLSSLFYILWLVPSLGVMVLPLYFTSCLAGYLFHRYKNIMAPNAVIAIEFIFVIYLIVQFGLI